MDDAKYPRPEHAPVHRSHRAAIAYRAGRVLCAALPLALGVLVLWRQSEVRIGEAFVAQAWLGDLMNGPVGQTHDVIFFPWVSGPIIGMKITAECTVAYLLVPMCVFAALLTALTRSSLVRLGTGLLLGSALLIVVNQIRIGIIAMSTQHWGLSGYDLTHKLVGTVVALIGFTVAALVMLMVVTGRRRGLGRRGIAS